MVKETHGNAYQSGFPDLFATHPLWKMRWIEVKYAYSFEFTKAQLRDYPKMGTYGCPVYVLTFANEVEYLKLFHPTNNLNEYLNCFSNNCHDIMAWRRGNRSTPMGERCDEYGRQPAA